ncbi:hypothetical protein FACS189490_08640 [Clostridia bacterium]|nr:hypothetical protein FACS189490_08640 [Clostridia bacterium]
MGKEKEAYQTLALADDEKKDAQTKQSMPSEKAVKDAKRWVDDNEK